MSKFIDTGTGTLYSKFIDDDELYYIDIPWFKGVVYCNLNNSFWFEGVLLLSLKKTVMMTKFIVRGIEDEDQW